MILQARMIIMCVFCIVFANYLPSAVGQQKPSTQDVAAVVQAVEDEIYDYGYEKDYVNIGTTGAISSPTSVELFVSSEFYDGHHGVVIYKFMPFGEVQRRFAIGTDGMAVLFGKPLNRFPATQPDTNTLYLRDEDVCGFKQKALKAAFTVNPDIDLVNRRNAAKRQLQRVGYSQYFETLRKKGKRQ